MDQLHERQKTDGREYLRVILWFPGKLPHCAQYTGDRRMGLLPFDGGRWFTGDIVDHPPDFRYLPSYGCGDPIKKVVR